MSDTKSEFNWIEEEAYSFLHYEGCLFLVRHSGRQWELSTTHPSGMYVEVPCPSRSEATECCENWIRKNLIQKMNDPIEAPERTWIRNEKCSICFINGEWLKVELTASFSKWAFTSSCLVDSGVFDTREETEEAAIEAYWRTAK